jgi:hypothetical protein
MSDWGPLLPAALMGIERSPQWQAAAQAQAQAAAADAVQMLLAQVLRDEAQADPTATLLRAAGVLAVAQRAGHTCAPAAATPASPAPADPRPPLDDPRWLGALQRVLQDAPVRLVHEAAVVLAQRGWRLPARLLPLALARATRDSVLRDALAPLLGERGQWLAAQRPQWQAVLRAPAQPTLDHWEHGSIAARAAYLRHERGIDAAAARQRLVQELPQQGARERAELVAALAVGLSMDDAPALQALLADRGREVRQQAATLLLRLPASDHGRYLATQAAALLRSEGGAPDGPRWLLDAPGAEDPAWKDHAIDPVRPKHDPLGERAWWLYQIVRQVPPPWWSRHLQQPPAAVVQWAATTDWADALLRGWRDALLATAPAGAAAAEAPTTPATEPTTDAATDWPPGWAADWAQALLDAWPPRVLGVDSSAVQALLPLPRREAQWLQRLEAGIGRRLAGVTDLLQEITAACAAGESLSGPFGLRLAQEIRDDLLNNGAAGFGQYQRELMLNATALLPLPALEPLRQLPRLETGAPSQLEALAQLEQWVELRLALPGLPHAPASSEPFSSAPPKAPLP